jgi:hypothetical protein
MLGGLGGRDLIHQDGGILPPNRSRVGMILWFGRVTGDHHLGFGRPRMVHHLKGVNMSWRRSAIASRRFPEEMRGQGAQVYFEFAFSLSIAREGWKLVYDPEVQVHHFVGRRFDDDQRVNVSTQVLAEAAFNFYVSLLRYMQQGWRRHAAITWAYCVGAPKYPGRVRGLAFALRGDARGAALRREVSKAWSDAKELTTNDRASATARQFGLLNKKDVP